MVLHLPGSEPQARLGPVERLDLAFLVDRQHQGMHVEADDVLDLGRRRRDHWSA
jgi:hypothetical protein